MALLLMSVVFSDVAVPSWEALRGQDRELDSLGRRLSLARHPPVGPVESGDSLPDHAEMAKARGILDSVEIRGIETSHVAEEVRISIDARARFADLVKWLGEIEGPATGCRVLSWTFRAVDPRGGAVESRIELGCGFD